MAGSRLAAARGARARAGTQRSLARYERAKRVLDVAVAATALVLFLPLWGLIALLIVLTSPGPAIYRQAHVVGRGGREFTVFKFRTMYVGADDARHRRAVARFVRGRGPLAVVGGRAARQRVYKLVNDPRITPVGRVLRRTGLDEVPQFINVLRGEMSVVGPRAPLQYEYQLYGPQEKERLRVLPGITGWYQVRARSCVPFQEMVRLDLEYIQKRSLGLDLKIMLLTPWVMLTGKGAF